MRLTKIVLLMGPLTVGCGDANKDDDDDDWGNEDAFSGGWANESDAAPGSSGDAGSANNEEPRSEEPSGDGSVLESTDTGESDEEMTPIGGYNGIYNVEITDISGCSAESFWLREWGTGMMTISGDPDAANFDFGEGMVFGGSIGTTQLYHFVGDSLFYATAPGDTGSTERMARLDVENDGMFSMESTCWVMSGRFMVVVDEADDGLEFNDCTLDGTMNARQVSGGLCDPAK